MSHVTPAHFYDHWTNTLRPDHKLHVYNFKQNQHELYCNFRPTLDDDVIHKQWLQFKPTNTHNFIKITKILWTTISYMFWILSAHCMKQLHCIIQLCAPWQRAKNMQIMSYITVILSKLCVFVGLKCYKWMEWRIWHKQGGQLRITEHTQPLTSAYSTCW